MPPNRLAESRSPYLQQHASNPVEWYPWGDEALTLARQQQRPILLSIGYSACHWCHVMAHESFQDPATAEQMNRHFINIKVDREERPDLDKIYQQAHQLLNQRGGGWPLTLFLTPDHHIPFFAGTYFPPTPRHGLPAFSQILSAVQSAWEQQREAITTQNRQVLALLNPPPPPPGEPDIGIIHQAITQLAQRFDVMDGGFGAAPKFPHAETLELLLANLEQGSAHQIALHTLERMASGGIHDHLGGGFFRYSVDREWMIPHFEKMLYDNAALLACYSDALAHHPDPLFRTAAHGIAEWTLRRMQAPNGGYYSSLDADSEGEEGRYYLWQRQQIKALLPDPQATPFCAAYGLNETPNFEDHWHLYRHDPNLPLDTPELESARATLLRIRQQRPRPQRDEKQLTAWNARMIRGMARAARRFEQPRYLASAQAACDFLRHHLWRDNRLLAACWHDQSHLNAYLDDYLYLIDALWELLQLEWRSSDLEWALALIEVTLEQFADPAGGFFFTSNDHEPLIQRPKPWSDDALPAANGIAVRVLARFGYLLAESRFLESATATLRQAWPHIAALPDAHCTLLDGLQQLHTPPPQIILRSPAAQLHTAHQALLQRLGDHAAIFAIANEAQNLPPALASKVPSGRDRYYLCHGSHCSAALYDLEEVAVALGVGKNK